MIWLYSAVQDIVKSDEKYQELEQKGQDALEHMKAGQLWDGFLLYSDYLIASFGETLNVQKKVKALHKAFDLGKTARSELSGEKDPYAALGVLFILGSLVRHGDLPREVRF